MKSLSVKHIHAVRFGFIGTMCENPIIDSHVFTKNAKCVLVKYFMTKSCIEYSYTDDKYTKK